MCVFVHFHATIILRDLSEAIVSTVRKKFHLYSNHMLYKSMQVSRNIEKSKNNCREFLAKFIMLQLIHMFADLNYTQNTAIDFFVNPFLSHTMLDKSGVRLFPTFLYARFYTVAVFLQ